MSDGSKKVSLDPLSRASYLLAVVNPEQRLRGVAEALEEQDRLRKALDNSEKARQQGWNEANALRALLAKSVRVEEADFDGEMGCRFILGKDHVVAEWRGDGIASDTVFSEHPALEYGVTTTPLIRCMRMALDMAHWPVLCAMVAGPGDGQMKEIAWWLHGEEDDDE